MLDLQPSYCLKVFQTASPSLPVLYHHVTLTLFPLRSVVGADFFLEPRLTQGVEERVF